jgi:hypothetical protein
MDESFLQHLHSSHLILLGRTHIPHPLPHAHHPLEQRLQLLHRHIRIALRDTLEPRRHELRDVPRLAHQAPHAVARRAADGVVDVGYPRERVFGAEAVGEEVREDVDVLARKMAVSGCIWALKMEMCVPRLLARRRRLDEGASREPGWGVAMCINNYGRAG